MVKWGQKEKFCAGFVVGVLLSYLFNHLRLDVERISEKEDPKLTLASKVRVLCWMMTGPDNHFSRAIHSKRTWGKRCDKLLIISSQADPYVGAIFLNGTVEGYDNLWSKTFTAFTYIFENHLGDAEWFLKVDDDTYVIMENLRYFLKNYDPNQPIHFGFKFHEPNWFSGGAGYVLSKHAMKLLGKAFSKNEHPCNSKLSGPEDKLVADCLSNLKVVAGDSRDAVGRHRFLTFTPEHHLIPESMPQPFNWIWWMAGYPVKKEYPECCSETAITFHYIRGYSMYYLEYFLYYMRPYGINYLKLEYDNETTTVTSTLPPTTVKSTPPPSTVKSTPPPATVVTVTPARVTS